MSETFEKRPATGGNYVPLGVGELLDHDDRGLRVGAGSTTVEVAALAPDLFRVGMFPTGGPSRYESGAIAKEDWEPVEVSMQETGEELTLSTTAATARVSLNPLRVGFADASGREFAVDDGELGMGAVETPEADVFSEPLGSPVRLYKRREAGERYFGCGERTSGLEKTGSHQVFYNVDPPLGHTASFNNLYSSIPFTISIASGKAHGLLFDNTHRVEFDLAARARPPYYCAEGCDRLLRLLRAHPERRSWPLHRAHRPHPDAAAVDPRKPAVPLLLHERGRSATDRARFQGAGYPVRRHLPRHPLHGGLQGLHLEQGPLP